MNPVFDSVIIRENGLPTTITADEFFALPLSVRVRHVLSHTAEFLKRGQPVDQREALAELRRTRARAA
jgi:hypothetical protein